MRYEYTKRINGNTLDDKIKYEQEKKKYDRKCKHCGYTNRIINRYNKVICKHCGRYVFLNDIDEFKFRIGERIEKDVY